MTRFLDLITKNKKVTERLKPVTSIEQWEFPTQDALDNYITVLVAAIYVFIMTFTDLIYLYVLPTGILNSIKTFIQPRWK